MLNVDQIGNNKEFTFKPGIKPFLKIPKKNVIPYKGRFYNNIGDAKPIGMQLPADTEELKDMYKDAADKYIEHQEEELEKLHDKVHQNDSWWEKFCDLF